MIARPTVSHRCAVIYNPTKISDRFHALMEESLQQKGWGKALAGDSAEDPRRAMTRQALAEEVDLVIGAGGGSTQT
jgi:diacylglycerol kinase (ATP)